MENKEEKEGKQTMDMKQVLESKKTMEILMRLFKKKRLSIPEFQQKMTEQLLKLDSKRGYLDYLESIGQLEPRNGK